MREHVAAELWWAASAHGAAMAWRHSMLYHPFHDLPRGGGVVVVAVLWAPWSLAGGWEPPGKKKPVLKAASAATSWENLELMASHGGFHPSEKERAMQSHPSAPL